MKHSLLGLLALILLVLPANAKSTYIIHDDLILNTKFNQEINNIGNELTVKRNVNLYLAIYLDDNRSLETIQQQFFSTLNKPGLVLYFAKRQKRVEIFSSDPALEATFERKQVLSPFPTFLSALYIAMFYGNYEEKKEIMAHYGGTILPVLAQKSKGADTVKKISVALFNGYADIAEQVAASQNITLEHAVGNSNKITRNLLRIIFYGILLLAILFYIYKKFFQHAKKS